MQHTLDQISCANEIQLENLLLAVRKRYEAVRPDLDMVVVMLDKQADPTQQLDRIIEFLQNQKASSK